MATAKEKKIKLTEVQVAELTSVMKERQELEHLVQTAANFENKVLGLILDAHKEKPVDGIRFENGHLIIPNQKAS